MSKAACLVSKSATESLLRRIEEISENMLTSVLISETVITKYGMEMLVRGNNTRSMEILSKLFLLTSEEGLL